MWVYNHELCHHGILGMRWGVRRSQKQLRQGRGKTKSETQQDQKPKANLKTSLFGGKKLQEMTDNELKTVINRLMLEKQYAEIANSKLSKGQKYVKQLLDGSDVALDASKSLVNTVVTLKNPKGSELEKINKTKSLLESSSTIVKESKKIQEKVINKSKKKRPPELDFMDDQTLRDKVNRMIMEKQFNSFTSTQLERGKMDVKQVLDVVGSAVAITGSVVGIALAIKKAKSGSP